jgi:hypothetical protein
VYLINSSSALVYAIGTDDESSAPKTTAPAQYSVSNNDETDLVASTRRSPMGTSIHYRSTLNTVIKALRLWPSSYCITCQPFQVCTLLGPYAAHLQATFVAPSTARGDLERDLIRETITCIAEYWGIGAATLGKSTRCVRYINCVSNNWPRSYGCFELHPKLRLCFLRKGWGPHVAMFVATTQNITAEHCEVVYNSCLVHNLLSCISRTEMQLIFRLFPRLG